MPASVRNASPTRVMPAFLAKSFTASRVVAANENAYRDGSRQIGLLVNTSRKSFEAVLALSSSQLTAMRAFYESVKGGRGEFWFYYGPETSPAYTHDPTGVASAGRYSVVFESDWSQTVGMGRGEAQIRLIEVN